ncbi:hypothetical protein BDZ97DRAFT_2061970 [Flammula alnicola]|nr:hypothetical protein BDZ97DRAFT_2061970 [Flammula alnicola]
MFPKQNAISNTDASPDLSAYRLEFEQCPPTDANNHNTLNNNDTSDQSTEAVDCICGFSIGDGFSIACDICSRLCHGACFSIAQDGVPDDFECWVRKPRPPADKEHAVRLQKERLGIGGSVLLPGGLSFQALCEDGREGKQRRKQSPGNDRKHRRASAATIDTGGAGKRKRQLPPHMMHNPFLTFNSIPQVLPPTYGIHTTTPIPSDRFITPYTFSIAPRPRTPPTPSTPMPISACPNPSCTSSAPLSTSHLIHASSATKAAAEEETLGFGVFVLHDLKAGEEIVLAGSGMMGTWCIIYWHYYKPRTCSFYRPRSSHHSSPSTTPTSPHEVQHIRNQMSNILHALLSTFTTCACGDRAKDCALTQMAAFVEGQEHQLNAQRQRHEHEHEQQWDHIDLRLLIRRKRGFKTRERIPFSGGIGEMEMCMDRADEEGRRVNGNGNGNGKKLVVPLQSLKTTPTFAFAFPPSEPNSAMKKGKERAVDGDVEMLDTETDSEERMGRSTLPSMFSVTTLGRSTKTGFCPLFNSAACLSAARIVHSPMKEDDTMISMLGGGGHVRRRSIEASPCPHVEKRKHSALQGIHMYKGQDQYESPNKARIVEKPSIASTSSFQFGGEQMIKAQHGLLERQSLEDSCLIADGEELISAYRAVPIFSRPGPAARSRSSTCTSSSGTDTPPLSASDDSSISEGSQSSIDLSQINVTLSNATHPMSTFSMNRVRARARSTGHRQRYSKAHISRSSVYETIEEEMMSSHSFSPAQSLLSKKSSATTRQPIFIVDHDTVSINSQSEEPTWDDERGIVALRKYYAFRDEAHTTITFQAPAEPAGMQAPLKHSVQTYGPLPSDLRPRRMRSRTSSRPSPYPQARISKGTLLPEQTWISNSIIDYQRIPVLQQKPINKNIHMMTTAPSLEVLKPFSPLVMDIEPKHENAFGLAPNVRPRVGSTARRTALGWSKHSNGNGKSSTDQKENVAATGIVMTPGDTLRINRPRPRGRPTPGGRTPASQNQAIRIQIS